VGGAKLYTFLGCRTVELYTGSQKREDGINGQLLGCIAVELYTGERMVSVDNACAIFSGSVIPMM